MSDQTNSGTPPPSKIEGEGGGSAKRGPHPSSPAENPATGLSEFVPALPLDAIPDAAKQAATAPLTPEGQRELRRLTATLMNTGGPGSLRTGSKTNRDGLVLSTLGKRHRRIGQDLIYLRKAIECALKDHGQESITLWQRAQIQSICRLEMTCRVREKMLRSKELTAEQTQTIMADIVRCVARRDALLAALLGKTIGEPAPAIDWEEVRRATCEDDK